MIKIAVATGLFLSLLVSALPTTLATAYTGSGAGTQVDPYLITSCDEFMEIDDELDAYYSLSNDIDCSSDGNSIIVADSGNFTGTFEGNNNEIIVNINRSGTTNTGLFAVIWQGTVQNLEVSGSVVSDSDSTGMLAGYVIWSTLTNVHTSGTVNSTDDNVGGLAGRTLCDSVITNSSSSVSVTGINSVGGLSGSDGCEGPGSTWNDSFATGDVSGADYVGGAIGQANTVHLEDVYATGDVTGTGYIGGLVGQYSSYDADYMVFHTYATGDVTGTGSDVKAGGLIGDLDSGIVSQSYATGDVDGDEGSDAGGFVGDMDEDSYIYNSFSRGNVTMIAGGDDVGGFAGDTDEGSNILNSYSTGSISKVSNSYAGFTADVGGKIHYSFWDTQTSTTTTGCGGEDEEDCNAKGKTTAQMKQVSTFTAVNWNFSTIWGRSDAINNGYPYLLGGDHQVVEPPAIPGPVETILDHNKFIGGGVGQGWNEDDEYWEYELPFDFSFYGEEYSTVYVDSNGYIGFDDDGDMGDYNFELEDGLEVPIIVALSGDLDTDCGSEDNPGEDIYITDNGDGKVVFRWDVASHDNCTDIFNFEIVLYEDGTFDINYGDMDTIDLEDIEGDVGVHNGEDAYVFSEYTNTEDLDNVNTSAWDYEDSIDDNDGVDEDIENGGPNGGDSNNDGTPDSQQAKVTSVKSAISNKYVVLESSVCENNNSVSITSESIVDTEDDDNYEYPSGLLNFTLTGCGIGATETVSQYYYGDYDINNVVVRKYNSTDHTYTTIDSATISSMTIGGENLIKVSYQVTDGGQLDADGAANGTIVDPAGLAVLGISSPNTGYRTMNTISIMLSLSFGTIFIGYFVYASRSKKDTQQ